MKQVIFCLYAGFLSFMCAEVFSGTSPNWIVSPLTWLVTYPLYLSHFLFFCGLAHLTKRTSLGSLYLWGVLFGLYETWVTKVAWAGYMGGEGFSLGGLFGFGIHETVGVILFYHPVVSFIIPLMILGILFPSVRKEFPLPSGIFGTDKMNRIYRYILIAGFGIAGAHSLSGIDGVLITWIPSLLVCYLGYRYLSRNSQNLDNEADQEEKQKDELVLTPSRRGTILWGGFILLFYIASYFLLMPEKIPEGFIVQLYTLWVYGFILFLLYKKNGVKRSIENYKISPKVPLLSLLAIFGVCFVLAVVKLFAPVIISHMTFLVFLSLIPAGVVLFIVLGWPKKA